MIFELSYGLLNLNCISMQFFYFIICIHAYEHVYFVIFKLRNGNSEKSAVSSSPDASLNFAISCIFRSFESFRA
jgi:hypothetical protein